MRGRRSRVRFADTTTRDGVVLARGQFALATVTRARVVRPCLAPLKARCLSLVFEASSRPRSAGGTRCAPRPSTNHKRWPRASAAPARNRDLPSQQASRPRANAHEGEEAGKLRGVTEPLLKVRDL